MNPPTSGDFSSNIAFLIVVIGFVAGIWWRIEGGATFYLLRSPLAFSKTGDREQCIPHDLVHKNARRDGHRTAPGRALSRKPCVTLACLARSHIHAQCKQMATVRMFHPHASLPR